MSANRKRNWNKTDRRDFIGGSDARIIMGQDEKASTHVHRRLKTRISG
jgi:predicted phage-related endonuclease